MRKQLAIVLMTGLAVFSGCAQKPVATEYPEKFMADPGTSGAFLSPVHSSNWDYFMGEGALNKTNPAYMKTERQLYDGIRARSLYVGLYETDSSSSAHPPIIVSAAELNSASNATKAAQSNTPDGLYCKSRSPVHVLQNDRVLSSVNVFGDGDPITNKVADEAFARLVASVGGTTLC